MTVEPYDFTRPGRLPVEPEQRLTGWLRSVGMLAPKKWAKDFPYPVSLTFGSIEVQGVGEALGRLGEGVIGYRIEAGENLPSMLVAPRPLVLGLGAGLLGDPEGKLPEDRELTVVEESLWEYLVQDRLLPAAQETWPDSEPLGLRLGSKEAQPRWTRIFPRGESVVILSLKFAGPFGEDYLRWFWPHKGLLGLLKGKTGEPDEPAASVRPRLEALVRGMPVQVAVALGSVEIPIAQLAKLRAGDLIILNQRIADPLSASVNGKKKFRVWSGRVGPRQAFLIDSLIES